MERVDCKGGDVLTSNGREEDGEDRQEDVRATHGFPKRGVVRVACYVSPARKRGSRTSQDPRSQKRALYALKRSAERSYTTVQVVEDELVCSCQNQVAACCHSGDQMTSDHVTCRCTVAGKEHGGPEREAATFDFPVDVYRRSSVYLMGRGADLSTHNCYIY